MSQIPKLIVRAAEKMFLLETNTMTKLLMFRMKYIIDGGCSFGY